MYRNMPTRSNNQFRKRKSGPLTKILNQKEIVYKEIKFESCHNICENPDSYFRSHSGEQVIPVTFLLSLGYEGEKFRRSSMQLHDRH